MSHFTVQRSIKAVFWLKAFSSSLKFKSFNSIKFVPHVHGVQYSALQLFLCPIVLTELQHQVVTVVTLSTILFKPSFRVSHNLIINIMRR